MVDHAEEKITYSKKYQVRLDEFEGPLDLLLHLIKTSEINIYDIPISQITQQYLEYLSLLVELDLDNLSEFVELAATLILIKSKTMLPVQIDYDEDEEDPRESLVQKLLEYQKYKIAAGLLELREEENIPIVARESSGNLFEDELDENNRNWKELSIMDLLGAFAKVLNSVEEDASMEVVNYNVTVEDKINEFHELLHEKESCNYFDIVRKGMSKIEIVCTFLAILELVKIGMIRVEQHIIFGDIHIVRKKTLEQLQHEESGNEQ